MLIDTPGGLQKVRYACGAIAAATALIVLTAITFAASVHACPPREGSVTAADVIQIATLDAEMVVTSALSSESPEDDACCAAVRHCSSTCSSATCSAALAVSTLDCDLNLHAVENDLADTAEPPAASADVDFGPPRLIR